jgi:hypothetical protein
MVFPYSFLNGPLCYREKEEAMVVEPLVNLFFADIVMYRRIVQDDDDGLAVCLVRNVLDDAPASVLDACQGQRFACGNLNRTRNRLRRQLDRSAAFVPIKQSIKTISRHHFAQLQTQSSAPSTRH